MAEVEFPIRISVSAEGAQTGAKKVEDSLGGVEKKAGRVDARLKAMVGTLLAFGTARNFIRLEEEADNLNDRIRSVTVSGAEAAAVYDQLFEVSQRTATSFAGNAETFQRLTRVQDVLGTSLRENIEIIETINSILKASGESADEARTGLNRFVVALTSGEVSGRELTTVLRQLPSLATLLAKQLGISQQRLIVMGDRGELSVEKIIQAILGAREEVRGLAAEDTPTLSESFRKLGNVGILAVDGIAQRLDSLGKTTVDTAKRIEAALEETAVGRFFLKGLGGTLGVLGAASDDLFGKTKKTTVALQEQSQVAQELGTAFEGIVTLSGDLGRKTDGTTAALDRQSITVEDLSRKLEEERKIQERLIVQGEAAARVQEFVNEAAKKGVTITEAQISALIRQSKAVDAVASAGELVNDVLQAEIEYKRLLAGQDVLRLIALGQTSGELRLTAEEQARLNLALERSAEVVLRARVATEEFRNELSSNFKVGLIDGIREITSVGEALQTGVTNALGNAEDAIVSFVRTGQVNFREFANSVLDDITRIIVRLLVLQAIEAISPGGLGGLIGGIAGAAGRQHGGPVSPGRQYLVGEHGPELFAPREPGRIVPAPVGGGGAGGEPAPVNITVANFLDPKDIETAIASGAMDRVIINRISRNRRAMEQAQRG